MPSLNEIFQTIDRKRRFDDADEAGIPAFALPQGHPRLAPLRSNKPKDNGVRLPAVTNRISGDPPLDQPRELRPEFQQVVDESLAQPPPATDLGIMDQITNIGSRFAKGLATGTAAFGKAIGVLQEVITGDPASETPIFRASQALEEGVQSAVPGFEQDFGEGTLGTIARFAVETVPEALGQTVPLMAAGAAGRGLGAIGQFATTAAAGAALQSSSLYQQAIAAGASKSVALWAAFKGIPIGATEAISLGRLFRRFDKASGGQFNKSLSRMALEVAKGTGEEAGQELVQTMLENAAAKAFDADRGLRDDVGKATATGGAVGAILNTLGIVLGGRKARRFAKTIEASPEAAQKFAEKKQPSRRDLQDLVGDAETAKNINAKERAELAQQMKEEIEQPAPTQASEAAANLAKLRAADESVRQKIEQPVQPQQKPEPTAPSLEDFTPTQLNARAKSAGVKLGPKREVLIERIREAEGPQQGDTPVPPPGSETTRPGLGFTNEFLEQPLSLRSKLQKDIQRDDWARGTVAVVDGFYVVKGVDGSGRNRPTQVWKAPEGTPDGLVSGKPLPEQLWKAPRNRTAAEVLEAERQTGIEPTGAVPARTARPELPGSIPGGLAFSSSSLPAIVRMDDVASLIRKGVSKTKAFAQRFLASRGDLPDKVFQAKFTRDGRLAANVVDVVFNLHAINKAADEVFGGRINMPGIQWEKIDDVFKGNAEPDTLAEEFREPVAAFRRATDAMSARLIELGLVEGELAARVDENIGTYVTRTYRVHTDPKWAQNVSPEVRNRFKATLRKDFPKLTPDQLDGRIESLLFEGKAADTPIAWIARGAKLGAKDLGILRHRQDLSPELRALFGENRDPRHNYAMSVAKMSQMIENEVFLNEVLEDGLGKYLFKEPVITSDGEFKVQIEAAENETMSPLNGLYTTPQIRDAFSRVFTPHTAGAFMRTYMKIVATVKIAKTVGSYKAHVRNTVANPYFHIAQGHFNFDFKGSGIGAPVGAAAGFAVAGPAGSVVGGMLGLYGGGIVARGVKTISGKYPRLRPTKETTQELQRLQRLGIYSSGARAGELRAIISDAVGDKDGIEFLMDRRATRLLGHGLKFAAEAYHVEDDVWKGSSYYLEREAYSKAKPDWSDAKIDAAVAPIVRNTFPNWDSVPELIQILRRAPFVGSFVSFAAETFRTRYQTLLLINREMRDPDLRGIASRRIAGQLATLAIPAAIAKGFMLLNGVSEQDDEDLREFLPPWTENNRIVHLGKSEDGTEFRYLDLGYTFPSTYQEAPVMAFFRGDDWVDGLKDAAFELMRPFLSEDIFTERVLDIKRNKKKNGGQIWNPQDSLPRQVALGLAHLAAVIEPSTITDLRNIEKGTRGLVNDYGRAYDAKRDSVALITGQRVETVNLPQGLSFRARNFQRDMTSATRQLTKVANRRGKVGDGEIRAAYDIADRSRRKLFARMVRRFIAARNKGVSEEHAIKIVRSVGISEDMVKNIQAEQYEPFKPGTTFLSFASKSADVIPLKGAAEPAEFKRRRRLVEDLYLDALNDSEKSERERSEMVGSQLWKLTAPSALKPKKPEDKQRARKAADELRSQIERFDMQPGELRGLLIDEGKRHKGFVERSRAFRFRKRGLKLWLARQAP